MNIHEQYNLVFRRVIGISGLFKVLDVPTCSVNQDGVLPHLQGELSSFIGGSNDSGGGLVDTMVNEIQDIIDGTWNGVESEEDNVFITDFNAAIRLDINDGYAYLGQEDYGWSELPKIPLTDLKAIFEEWITFRDWVYNSQ